MAVTVTIGVLYDTADFGALDGGFDAAWWVERELAALAREADREITLNFVHGYAFGFPSGTAEAVEAAFRDLVDQGADLVLGPAIADNALTLMPLSDSWGVPTLTWCDTARARSRFLFQLPTGSQEHEPEFIVRHLAARGCRRLAVFHDHAPASARMARGLSAIADSLGMAIIARGPMTSDDAASAADLARTAAIDGIVALGGDTDIMRLALCLTHAGWSGHRIMDSASQARSRRLENADQILAGWCFSGTVDETNAQLHRVVSALDAPSLSIDQIALGHDLGRLVAGATAQCSQIGRKQLQVALEGLAWLPAASGMDGTRLGFGAGVRGALHGPYLTARHYREDGGGIEAAPAFVA